MLSPYDTSYTRSVTRSTQRLEALLKVIVTPQVRYLSKKEEVAHV
jgi:hypothetical protein